MASSDQSMVTLKLLVDKKASRVLFAEADKAFVDFLFSILALPIGTVTSLLKKNEGTVGSLGTLYKSIESLSNSYTVSDHSKEAVLHPKVALSSQVNTVPLLGCTRVGQESTDSKTWYKCPYKHCSSNSVSDQPNIPCTSCGRNMSVQVEILSHSSGTTTTTKSACGGGYVKGVVTYMVMDDLSVKPMSTISGITLLNTFNVKDLGSLEEKTVNLGMPEVVIVHF